MTDFDYFVCFNCAHYYASPNEWPRRCENCGHDAMHECETVERAEELSEAILRERGPGYGAVVRDPDAWAAVAKACK